MYHFDEEAGCRFAELLVLKGYTNIKLLSGGIEEFGALYEQDLEGINKPKLKVAEVRWLIRNEDSGSEATRIQEIVIASEKATTR